MPVPPPDPVPEGGGGLPAGGTVGQVVTNTAPGVGDWEDAGAGSFAPATRYEAGGADPITNLGAVDFAFKEGADNWVEIIDDPDSAGNPRLRILNPATGDAYVEAGLVSTGFPGISIKDGGSVAAEISETRIVLGDPAGAPLFSALMNDGVYLSDGAQSRVRLDATTGGITLADSTGIGSGDRVAILPDGTGLILYNASGDPIWSLADDGSLGGTAPNDGDVATWDAGAGKWVAAASSGLLQSARWVDLGTVTAADLVSGGRQVLYSMAAGEFVSQIRFGDTLTPLDQTSEIIIGIDGLIGMGGLKRLASVGVSAGDISVTFDWVAATTTTKFDFGLGADVAVVPLLAGDLIATLTQIPAILGPNPSWQANHAYPTLDGNGDPIAMVIAAGHMWQAISAGTSGGSTPNFAGNIGGGTGADGTISNWADVGLVPTAGSVHLYAEIVTPSAP